MKPKSWASNELTSIETRGRDHKFHKRGAEIS